MKALTIKQPWASLIANGIKDIENRTWKTNYRGRIYIHASAKPAASLVSSVLNYEQTAQLVRTGGLDHNYTSKLPSSAIIGEVDIVDCVINHPSIWAEQSTDPIKNIYNWVLANAVLYNKPILNVKGRLSFWEYERPYQVIGTAEIITPQSEWGDTNEVNT